MPLIPRVRGFSMVELLVAVLVMGIGVLGITGLQVVSLQNNRAALMRSEATQLAYDMLDRIRANPVGAAYALDTADDPPNGGNCHTGNCSSAQMVAFDQAVWKCQLGAYDAHSECTRLRGADLIPSLLQQPGLPNGNGSVVLNGNVITVTVTWDGVNGQDQNVTVDSRA